MKNKHILRVLCSYHRTMRKPPSEPSVRRGMPRGNASVLAVVWWAVAVLATAGITWWATTVALTPPRADPSSAGRTVVTVTQATIGSTLSVGVTLSQPVIPQSTNLLAGVVTEVSSTPTLSEGQAAYAVAGVPVVVVGGKQPFYRPLTPGMTGADVTELQNALARLGFLRGASDGRFGVATTDAVKALQRATGQASDGNVRLGELIAVPSLPIPLRLGSSIITGALLNGGEEGVLGPVGARTFRITLSPDRFAQIPTGAEFRIRFKNWVWNATASNTVVDDNQNVTIDLIGTDGNEVCGQQCASLPSAEKYTLRGEAVIAPPTSGPAVAASAIRTDPDGQAYVTLATGKKQVVTVKGSQGGVAVVEGLQEGDRVVLPSGAASDKPTVPAPTSSRS